MAAIEKDTGSAKRADEEALRFSEQLLARAPAEDAAAYDEAELARTGSLALAALKRHVKGGFVIAIDEAAGILRGGKPVTAITVVNDNMPFLFDSVIGEITESAGEPLLVVHPVLQVRRDDDGNAGIVGEGSGRSDPKTDRVSLIHVHVPRLSAERADGLEGRLTYVLSQVRAAVEGWKPMLARLDRAISEFRYGSVPLDKDEVAEAIALLEWLRDDNFTFLGMREFAFAPNDEGGSLERAAAPGLGILSDPDVRVLRRGDESVNDTPEIRAFLHGPEPLIVTKANAHSVVHRRAYLDYIGVKTFHADGRLSGELRIVGLFTSTAYTRSVMSIPYLRSKAKTVLGRSGFDPNDHSGKALTNVLESYPRDELFQIGAPLLRKHAAAILALGERPRVRALYRHDQFDRFVSVIVFVPRDRYDSSVRQKIGDYLKNVFAGRVSAFYPAFPEGALARVHFIIGRSGGKTPKLDAATLEAGIRAIVRTWDDALREAAAEAGADAELAAAAKAMPESYKDSFPPKVALRDARFLASLSAEKPIAVDFYRVDGEKPEHASLKIYHHGKPLPLSRRVPLLENMGFAVISERTFETGAGSFRAFLHDMEVESARGQPVDLSDEGALLEELFLSVCGGEADDDGYNALAQTARLRASEIVVLRAYGRYLQQAGIPQSQDFIAAALNRYPDIARSLFQLFVARFDPRAAGDREAAAERLRTTVEEALQAVPNIDDDSIIRRYLNLIGASLRTNHFIEGKAERGQSLAIKLDSKAVEGLPAPRPWREIFIYGPQVEGVHLRFGAVARGGIRWSDRAQDYRTEVLGLVKAQQVKNAVIVPVGAKGGFFPKRLPAGGSRDAIEAGRRAYVNFISSLLSITDNLVEGKVVPPEGLVRHDGDDPYFVVAADKGTATFSDTANRISQAHDFWLDDAFASGGSAGYDHKKMGITARGAWEAVKRHFREMDRDIQAEPFTVAGVGDMSGDVFGNGMLLSPQIRLVAAFDHRDIFIDPEPDPAASLAERRRLFDLPRSSWQDYDRTKLSIGAMIVPRTQKSVTMSPQAAAAIGMDKTVASPSEIIGAILRAPVDLLWFGGIGTYVRASGENNAEVGDKGNDAIRITATEVRAKVIGEGANLGVTQRARIEYGLAGGRCNSDAIDNSAGVNCSDVEVNIKIALAAAMRAGRLERPARDRLLAEMTEEVAGLVLANNYAQPLAISLAERRGLADLPHQARMMTALEGRGLLDRAVEFLPTPAALAEREARREPLTRAETGVLLAYAKLVLFDDLVASGLPDDPHLESELFAYFPDRMDEVYRAEIEGHRLRREIIATRVTNDIVNRGGPTFISRLQDLTGRSAADVAAAALIARDGFDLTRLAGEIDALDGKIDGAAQLRLYARLTELLQTVTAWILRNDVRLDLLGERIAALGKARRELEPQLPDLLPASVLTALASRTAEFVGAGAPEILGRKLAFLDMAEVVPDIALVARQANSGLPEAAKAYFAVTDAFRIGSIEDAARSIVVQDYYDGLALARANAMIAAARRGMAVAALKQRETEDPAAAWLEAGGERVARARERLRALTESGDISVSRLSVAAGLLADLAG